MKFYRLEGLKNVLEKVFCNCNLSASLDAGGDQAETVSYERFGAGKTFISPLKRNNRYYNINGVTNEEYSNELRFTAISSL
jgi:hypothetical protein